MDNLKSLMRCVDDISKMIPEGTYLEMCDNLKQMHDKIPKNDDPPLLDSRRPPPVNVPFQVVQPGMAVHRIVNHGESDSEEPWQPEWYVEWTQNENCLRRLIDDLKFAKQGLRILKPIQRMTKNHKECAMRYFTARTPILEIDIFDGNETDEATFENYVRITEWSDFSPEDRKEYTSKKFEKGIYDDYKMRENSRIQRLIDDSRELKRNLEIEISDVRDRQDYLRHHYNL